MRKFLRILNSDIRIARYMPNFWHWYGFGVTRYWSGRIIHVDVGVAVIILDWRKDSISDMISGVPE